MVDAVLATARRPAFEPDELRYRRLVVEEIGAARIDERQRLDIQLALRSFAPRGSVKS
jgi:hypothetical protein